MASFKELTLPDGEKIVVNMEEIRTMQRYGNSPETRIAFAHDHGVTERRHDEAAAPSSMRETIRNCQILQPRRPRSSFGG
jgi:hypothetical protein